jgi:hypothetical protein
MTAPPLRGPGYTNRFQFDAAVQYRWAALLRKNFG